MLPHDRQQALTRRDSLTDDWYDCSAHLLWVGDRTRQLDGAHVEFLAGVYNPVGVKLGPTATPDDVVALCERLNPDRLPGRLTLISRMGAGRVEELLPPLVRAVTGAGHPVSATALAPCGKSFEARAAHAAEPAAAHKGTIVRVFKSGRREARHCPA